jgi:hypothetical protein
MVSIIAVRSGQSCFGGEGPDVTRLLVINGDSFDEGLEEIGRADTVDCLLGVRYLTTDDHMLVRHMSPPERACQADDV